MGKQSANGFGGYSVQRNNRGATVVDHSPEPRLSGWIADNLRQRSGWNPDTPSCMSASRKSNHATVIALQCNESAGVEDDFFHAALRLAVPLFAALDPEESALRAHAFSFAVKGPPVCSRA